MALPVSAGPSGPIVARILLEIEAVHLRPDQPFTLTSGRASPVYIDCRKIISFPRARRKVIELAAELVPDGTSSSSGCRFLLRSSIARSALISSGWAGS